MSSACCFPKSLRALASTERALAGCRCSAALQAGPALSALGAAQVLYSLHSVRSMLRRSCTACTQCAQRCAGPVQPEEGRRVRRARARAQVRRPARQGARCARRPPAALGADVCEENPLAASAVEGPLLCFCHHTEPSGSFSRLGSSVSKSICHLYHMLLPATVASTRFGSLYGSVKTFVGPQEPQAKARKAYMESVPAQGACKYQIHAVHLIMSAPCQGPTPTLYYVPRMAMTSAADRSARHATAAAALRHPQMHQLTRM